MAVLRIDFEGIASSKAEIDGQKADFESLYSSMKTTVNNLPEYWEGETAQSYVQQFEDLAPSFNAIIELMEGLSTQLNNISQNFSSADSGMAGQIGV